MALSSSTQQTAPVQPTGLSWVQGQHLISIDFQSTTVKSWLKEACRGSVLNTAIAKLPANNIIMSIPEHMSAQGMMESLNQNNERVCGLLIASRGSAQASPCQRCLSPNGRSPFEKCFIIDELRGLGCASYVFSLGDSDGDDPLDEADGVIAPESQSGHNRAKENTKNDRQEMAA